tara:strand:+ start:352 stop:1347 length:996 start_codon:yes stop_codon:yes gene_type:complete
MTTAITVNTKPREWLSVPEIKSDLGNALGAWMPENDFVSQMLIAFQKPELKDCTPQSLFEAAHACASLRLLPSANQVALITRNIKGKKQATVMAQWQGYKAIMERHPDVLEVECQLVHVNDQYGFDENGVFQHSFDPFAASRTINTEKDLAGGYLRILYTNGRPPKLHFVPIHEIIKRRKCAQTQTIWKSWFAEMARKTVYRDGFTKRVTPFDPFNESAAKTLASVDDIAMGNNPIPKASVSSVNQILEMQDSPKNAMAKPDTVPDREPEKEESTTGPLGIYAEANTEFAKAKNKDDVLAALERLQERVADNEVLLSLEEMADRAIEDLQE